MSRIVNINPSFGDAVEFDTLEELVNAIKGCGYEIPEGGLREGKDYEEKLPATWLTNGNPWQHPYAVKNALCFDGRRRTVRLNVQPDTYYSWSGRTKIKGKSIRGYVDTNVSGDAVFYLLDSEWKKLGIEKNQ